MLNNKPNYKYLQEDTKEEGRQLIEQTQQTILKAERCDGFKITRDIESADALEENKIHYTKHLQQVKQRERTIYNVFIKRR